MKYFRCLIVFLAYFGHTDTVVDYQSTLVVVTNPDGSYHSLRLEVARTPQERAAGLMYRRYLPDGGGMIFLYPKPKIMKMWMKNTYIDLDIIFVRDDRRVEKIIAKAAPGTEKLYSPDVSVSFVIELPGGTATKLGIVPDSAIAVLSDDQS